MTDYLDFFNKYIMGAVQMLTGFYFYVRFLKRRVGLLYFVLSALLGIVIMTVIRSGGFAEFASYLIFLAANGILLCKADIATAFLYAIVTGEIMQLCYGIVNSVLCLVYPLMKSFDGEIIGNVFMLSGNIALPAAVLCCFIIYKHLSYDETDKSRYALMLIMPALTVFLVGQYIGHVIYGNTITTDGTGKILNADHFQMLAVQLLAMASLFCIMFAYKKLLENFRLNTKLSLLEQEEHSLNRYVDETKTRYEKTKSFRHDIKNHMTVIKELLKNGNSRQALDYIGDMESAAEEFSLPCSTNNPVADILLGNKLGIAKSMGIDTACSLILPYPCPVRDIDFGIILSNALDNAINACKSIDGSLEKYIGVTGKIQGDFILIEIENSFQGKAAFKNGTGLSNIRAVAEKYDGAMSIRTQGSTFILSVLLIIPQHPESISRQNS